MSARPGPRITTPESIPDEIPGRPESLHAMFMAFTWLALQGFGGVMAVVQRELVERRRWLTREEFIEEWAIAQVMPGANVVNLSLIIGERFFGWRGAMVAVLGLLCVPLIVVWSIAFVYHRFAGVPEVAGALRGITAVAAGLILATGLKLIAALRTHPLGMPLCLAFSAVCFGAIALWKLPLITVLLVMGAVVCTLTWRKLAP